MSEKLTELENEVAHLLALENGPVKRDFKTLQAKWELDIDTASLARCVGALRRKGFVNIENDTILLDSAALSRLSYRSHAKPALQPKQIPVLLPSVTLTALERLKQQLQSPTLPQPGFTDIDIKMDVLDQLALLLDKSIALHLEQVSQYLKAVKQATQQTENVHGIS